MPETFLSLERAAELEGLKYEGLRARINRNPDAFQLIKAPADSGGRERIEVALSSLSVKAHKAYRAAQRIDAVALAPKTGSEPPWYMEVDVNQYITAHEREYHQMTALAGRVREYLTYGDGPGRTAYAAEMAQELGVSSRTLYRYAELVSEATAWALRRERETGYSYDYYAVLALCRKPKEANTFPSLTEEQKAIIQNIWFDHKFAMNLSKVQMLYDKFEQIAQERKWTEYPSIKTVRRYLHHLMEGRGVKSAHYYAANDPIDWRNKMMLKGKRDATSLKVMEYVVGDEHTFDFWVQWTAPNGKVKAVRPKLVAWMDMRSRAIIGDVACIDANSQTLKESLVKMIYSFPGGVPSIVHVDNGKDYTAKTMTGQNRKERNIEFDFDAETVGFYQSIGVQEVGRSLPYQPWDKPIERLFLTVCNSFSRWFDSYTGTLTGSKTYAKRQKDITGMLERGQLLTMDEFWAAWTKWKEEKYHTRVHRGLKNAGEKWVTPITLFKNGERYEKAAPPREYAAMLLMKAAKAKVTNQGINKFGTLYTDYELCHYKGEWVGIKWDIDDVTKLYVFDKNGRKICEAVSAELLAFGPHCSQAALENHLRKQKRQEREVREILRSMTQPYELREAEASSTSEAVGKLDLTIRAKRGQKIIALPADKEFRAEAKAKAAGNEYLIAKAQEAMRRLQDIG